MIGAVSSEQVGQDEILTVSELAALLKTKPSGVYELIRPRAQQRHRHPLPHFRLGEKSLRFSRRAVEQWLQRLQTDRVQ